jgi:lipopolysaccharide transport system ATP-binding protein
MSVVSSTTKEEFWALQNVDFKIEEGDRVGIIGRNGAGKSTLLKILSRITEPTSGEIKIKGRVASLLEVGTGFHPELTGRENIFLNGAILGMSRLEIRKKFDEIVDFSGVEKFLDTPVKRYSSGMYVRLAFAIAAHLEPEILIVDEVLAVGDAEFQKKCLGKMESVSKDEGRTVLFVSHDLAAITNLCMQSILLNKGTIVSKGDTASVINNYLGLRESFKYLKLGDRKDRQGFSNIRIIDYLIQTENSNNSVLAGGKVQFSFIIKNETGIKIEGVKLELGFNNNLGNRISWISTELVNIQTLNIDANETRNIRFEIGELPLMPGDYSINLYLVSHKGVEDWVKEAVFFTVEPVDFYLTGKLPQSNQGNLLLKFSMKDEKTD